VPTPLLVGENSSEHMAAASRHLSQEVVGAENVTLSGQVHIAHVMDPVRLAEIIKDFLSR
jgi:pimeloyl-ACP methyl ester carboxylesterase